MRRFFIVFVLVGALSAPFPASYAQRRSKTTAAAAAASPARKAAEDITAAQLKDYLSFVASDEIEGRDTPSRNKNVSSPLDLVDC